MKDEIKEIKLWKEKTKGIFHITEYTRFWNYITNLQELNENKTEYICDLVTEKINYKSRNEKAIEDIDLVIELIKQQPTGDDTWILNRLNGFKYLLQGEDKDDTNSR